MQARRSRQLPEFEGGNCYKARSAPRYQLRRLRRFAPDYNAVARTSQVSESVRPAATRLPRYDIIDLRMYTIINLYSNDTKDFYP